MKFGAVAPREALGAISVHAIRQSGVALKKGALIAAEDVAALEAAGVSSLVVARLESGDIGEDAAAAAIARAVAGDGVSVERAFTGRANIFAAQSGILVVDRVAIDAINTIDESITIATLPAFKPVVAGEMIATVKIIPFAIPGALCETAKAAAQRGPIHVAPFRVRRVGIVSTLLPGLAQKVIDKTLKVTAERLAAASAQIVAERRVAHDDAAVAAAIRELADAGAELIVVFGASAITDRRDVIPAALALAGGSITHFGMPVDPGNLLLLGTLGGRPVLGAPGCARSPKENGFDWVLMRLLAGLPVTRQDIAGMGVGGLLMEIVTRPQPRVAADDAGRKVAAIVLAAGKSSRMRGPNKLLADVGGRPLVRRVVEQVKASRASPVIVVTGHQQDEIARALSGLDVTLVHNPDFGEGIASSVRAGIAAVPGDADGVLICLGDMPLVSEGMIDALIARFAPDAGALIVVPVDGGRRGNPVLWSRRFFPELMSLEGDVGARHLIGRHGEAVAEVAVAGEGAFLDLDTPEALEAFGPGAARGGSAGSAGADS
jgi:molybdenum cofactor cytidylyltransferase